MNIKKIIAGVAISTIMMFAHNINVSEFSSLNLFNNEIQIKKAEDLGSIYHLLGIYHGRKLDLFVTKDKKYFIVGQGFNIKTKKVIAFKTNMTQYNNQAVFTEGSGKDQYYVFTDPECPFCKKFEKIVPRLKKYATFHFFLFPLSFHRYAKNMSRYILSLPKNKRASALWKIQEENNMAFKTKKYSANELEKVDQILQSQKNLASALGVNGTPTVFNKNGKNINWTTLAKKYNIKLPIDMFGVRYLEGQNVEITLGKGAKDLYAFFDPESSSCINMFKTGKIDKLKEKYKIHFFLYPSNNIDSKIKTAYILSIKNPAKRAKEFENIMKGEKLSKKDIEISKKILQNSKSNIFKYIVSAGYISEKMGINSIPTTWDKNGKRMEIK